MASKKTFQTNDLDLLKKQILYWADRFRSACYFDSNWYQDQYSSFDLLIGAGVKRELSSHSGSNPFVELQAFLEKTPGLTPGYFSYDLKNELEELESSNPDGLGFPELYFFQPLHMIRIKGTVVEVESEEPDRIWQEILEIPIQPQSDSDPVQVCARFSRREYIDAVNRIRSYIQRGDIYEMNFCQEFYAPNCTIDPVNVFLRLNEYSPTPFATYMKVDERYILAASPERFLSRRGTKLISQPIKGTRARSADPGQDEQKKADLRSDEKERSENVMIVDLVRNDLTKSASPGSVRVEELFGIYTFEQVHQMISTIVCDANPHLHNVQIIANTFPMGSMTGAPKISAMRIAEELERSKRGVYSGAAGYFDTNGDFDFNVVIRTILYDRSSKYLSYHTGGAITFDSDPEKEYEECLLKGSAIRDVLKNKIPGAK